MSGRQPWRFIDGVLLVLLVGGAVVATRGAWADIVEVARRSEEQSHILLALPVALWLGWLRRGRLRYCRPDWNLVGPAVILVGWLLAAVGFSQSVDVAWHLGAILVVVGAAVTVVGPRFVHQFLPSFLALVFLLPVPGRIRQPIALHLQDASAKAAHFFLDIFAVPVTRAGNVLNVNGVDVAVAEACNGMRMVSALALIAYAFIFSVPMRNSVRLLILAVSPLVALLVNIVRLIPSTLMYGYTDNATATLFHDVSGWAVLVLALGILWLFLVLLRWIEVPVAPYPVLER